MRKIAILALLTLGSVGTLSAASRDNIHVFHDIDSSMIDPFFYFDDPHTYRIADTQTISGMETDQYSVNWYVDTEEWDFDPETNHIFSKIEFKKGNKIIETFVDDDGWSYVGVENSRAIMFKSFKIDDDCTALLFQGGIYAAGIPNLTIFVICGDKVKVVFNKEYRLVNITDNKISIKKDSQGSEGTITISNGHISIVNKKEYPTGKIIY